MNNQVYVVTTYVETGNNSDKLVGVYTNFKHGYHDGLTDLKGDILDIVHCGMLTSQEMKEDLDKIDQELSRIESMDTISMDTLVMTKCEITITLLTVQD